MNNEFERMKLLLSDIGLAFEECGVTNAEIYAYSAGLEYVRQNILDTFNKIFINLDNNDNVFMYTELLDIDTQGCTAAELKSMIFKRLGQKYGDYTRSGFDEAFAAVGSGTYEISNGMITFSNVNAEDMKRLGRFIKGYVSLCTKAVCGGSGIDFDAWDRWGQSFNEYDNMGLTFDIIDTLRSDIIEQYK